MIWGQGVPETGTRARFPKLLRGYHYSTFAEGDNFQAKVVLQKRTLCDRLRTITHIL
jgi:hypothetical protein